MTKPEPESESESESECESDERMTTILRSRRSVIHTLSRTSTFLYLVCLPLCRFFLRALLAANFSNWGRIALQSRNDFGEEMPKSRAATESLWISA